MSLTNSKVSRICTTKTCVCLAATTLPWNYYSAWSVILPCSRSGGSGGCCASSDIAKSLELPSRLLGSRRPTDGSGTSRYLYLVRLIMLMNTYAVAAAWKEKHVSNSRSNISNPRVLQEFWKVISWPNKCCRLHFEAWDVLCSGWRRRRILSNQL
jgi:hypothetical protein